MYEFMPKSKLFALWFSIILTFRFSIIIPILNNIQNMDFRIRNILNEMWWNSIKYSLKWYNYGKYWMNFHMSELPWSFLSTNYQIMLHSTTIIDQPIWKSNTYSAKYFDPNANTFFFLHFKHCCTFLSSKYFALDFALLWFGFRYKIENKFISFD